MIDQNSYQIYQDSALSYLKSTDQRRRGRDLERNGCEFDRKVWSEIADMGWLGACVPEDKGGLGLELSIVCAMAQMCGQELLPEPIWDASFLPLQVLLGLKDTQLKNDLIGKIISGELVVSLAAQEEVGDVFSQNIKTTVSTQGPFVKLDGVKRFLRPGAEIDGWLVVGQMQGDFSVLWVPVSTAGLDLVSCRSVDGLKSHELIFNASLVSSQHVLHTGQDVLNLLLRAIEKTILIQCAQLIGLSERVMEMTCEYLRTRIQFSKPIGSNQAIQHRMVDLRIELELSKFSFAEVIRFFEMPGQDGNFLSSCASRLKARCASMALALTKTAIHFHGAIGTTNEYDVGLYFKRAMFLSAQFGNASFHKRRYSELSSTSRKEEKESSAETLSTEFTRDQDWNALSDLEFRLVVRSIFKQHYPEQRRYLPYRQSWSESKAWYMTLSHLGWLAPAWPKEHGGMGLTPEKLIAYIEETESWGVARCPDQGLVMVGPILMRFGTDEQIKRFLPKILAGEHIWTQGYSEPNAGSDLAAVQTSAVLEGDIFKVNGQKIWTTWGMDGTHMFMLVRTDKTVKKQAGISFLLVDLKSPGITVRSIENIAGETDFCEVFFDNVLVPIENLVGQINEGWTIAKALLGFERLFTGSPKHSQHTIHQVGKIANKLKLFDDPIFRSKFTDLQLDTEDLISAYTTFAAIAKKGEMLPASISMLKIWSTETYERLALLLIEAAQEYACIKDHCSDIDMHVVSPLFNAMGAKIFAGSNEIQRNILSKSVLNLPN